MSDLPEPLTPADCDLQDFPFMPLQVARLRDSDLAATEEPEACWYAVLLWAASWHQVPAASLPDDEVILTRICGLGRDVKTFRRLRAGAMRGFVKCTDGRLYHPVVAEQANRSWSEKLGYRDRKEKRIAAARTAAAARWTDQSQCEADAERNANGNAERMRIASDSDAQRMPDAMPKGTGTGTGTIPPTPLPVASPPDHHSMCQTIADEAGMLGIPPDHGLLRQWLALPDMEFERDILPVVRRVAAEVKAGDGRAPFKFKLFDAAIREQQAKDAAEIERLRRSRDAYTPAVAATH